MTPAKVRTPSLTVGLLTCLTLHGRSRIIGRMTTAIIHHPVFEQHDTGEGHPESPERYSVVMAALRGDGELWPRLLEVEASPAPRGDVQAAHSPQRSEEHT